MHSKKRSSFSGQSKERIFRNVGKYLAANTAQELRRLEASKQYPMS
jgi:hypothetical protein